MMVFIGGIVAGTGMALNKIIKFAPASPGGAVDIKLLLGIAAAGYAGADFIENAFTRLMPGLGAAPAAPQGAGAGAGAVAPAPVPPVSGAMPADAEIVGLAAALKVVAPKVNSGIWRPARSAAVT